MPCYSPPCILVLNTTLLDKSYWLKWVSSKGEPEITTPGLESVIVFGDGVLKEVMN